MAVVEPRPRTRRTAVPPAAAGTSASSFRPIKTGPHTVEVPGVYRGVDYRLEVSRSGPLAPLVWAARLLAVGPAVLVSSALLLQTTFWGEDPREAANRARAAVQEWIDETKSMEREDEKGSRRRRASAS